jgi:exodeoxyribonuclease V alpha subunit
LSQRDAIRLALASKALVITGGPGVGKTTIVNSILRILGVKASRCTSAIRFLERSQL